nr:tlde1 domain-containing protein [uncultured Enterobacter sp.]
MTFFEKVTRGHFRLHPAGYRGISKGCITLSSKAHFEILRNALLSTPTIMVSSSLRAYGTVQVY